MSNAWSWRPQEPHCPEAILSCHLACGKTIKDGQGEDGTASAPAPVPPISADRNGDGDEDWLELQELAENAWLEEN